MFRLIPAVVLAGAVCSACGATARDTGAPVYSPPSARAPEQNAPTGPAEVNDSARGVIPAGQELDVRLQTRLSSETSKTEERFEATTAADLTQNGRVLVPAGSTVRGVVSSVKPAGRVDRTGSLTLSFDRVTVRGRDYPIRAMATNVFESGGIREEAGTAGVGAGAGAIVGGILGGVKGAVLGAVIGAGGAVAATDGKDIALPAGSIVRIRLDSDVRLR